MSVRFSILMPSAEGQKPGGNPFGPDMFDYRSSNTFNYFNALGPERRALIDALHRHLESGRGLEALFGVKEAALEEALEADLSVYQSPLMAAIERYSPGVLYRATGFDELPTGAQRRLLEHGIIVSGMFGLLRPDDLIPKHRLKVGATVEGIGKVSRFWRPSVSPILNELLRGHVVWNLLPASHEEVWDDDGSYERMYRFKFYREEKGALIPLTHGVKAMRGNLIGFLVTALAESVEAVSDWEAPDGFDLDLESSELSEKGGTLAMVSRAGWEKRRAARRAERAQVEAERRARREAELDNAEE